jgi:hypothetical protein
VNIISNFLHWKIFILSRFWREKQFLGPAKRHVIRAIPNKSIDCNPKFISCALRSSEARWASKSFPLKSYNIWQVGNYIRSKINTHALTGYEQISYQLNQPSRACGCIVHKILLIISQAIKIYGKKGMYLNGCSVLRFWHAINKISHRLIGNLGASREWNYLQVWQKYCVIVFCTHAY